MTIYLEDIVNPDELTENINSGHMAAKSNPEGTKTLYCYTHKAQYDRAWNEVTTQLRGVVIENATGKVLARPFPKFFNHGDPMSPPDPEPDTPVVAVDKMDGSLAVLQPDGTMTSKGSFTSDVAKAATKLYQERYAGKWNPEPGLTYCFEFTSPDHRIVLDYGSEPELTLIGAVEIASGVIEPPLPHVLAGWPGPYAQVFGDGLEDGTTLLDALEMPPRPNAEGLVVIWGASQAVKLKQDDYLAMHKIVTNTNAITVWETMAVNRLLKEGVPGEDLARLLRLSPEKVGRAVGLGPNYLYTMSEGVPDEFHLWLQRTHTELYLRYIAALAATEVRQETAKKHATSRAEAAKMLQERYGDSEIPWNLAMDLWVNDGEHTPRTLAGAMKCARPSGPRWGQNMKEEE